MSSYNVNFNVWHKRDLLELRETCLTTIRHADKSMDISGFLRIIDQINKALFKRRGKA